MVPRLEATLWMASSATTFVKPNLNYLHGTPQSLDQAVLAVTVTTTEKNRGKREERHKIGYQDRETRPDRKLYSPLMALAGKRWESNNRVLCCLPVLTERQNSFPLKALLQFRNIQSSVYINIFIDVCAGFYIYILFIHF